MSDDVQSMTDTELYWRHKEAVHMSMRDRRKALEAEMVERWMERMEANRNV